MKEKPKHKCNICGEIFKVGRLLIAHRKNTGHRATNAKRSLVTLVGLNFQVLKN